MNMIKVTAALTLTALMLTSQPAMSDARVAVAHFAPFADTIEGTSVSVLVNGDVALENVVFGVATDYLPFAAGTYTIDIVPTGTDVVAITGEFTLEDNTDYSVFATGNVVTQDLALWALVDTTDAPMDGNLNIRVVHAAPFAADPAATEVSIRTAGGDVVNMLMGVPYSGESGFFQVPAGTYDLKVASNDGSVNYIDPLPAPLPAGADVTLFAIGDGINQPLGIYAYPVGMLDLRTPVDNRSNGMWEILEGSGTGFVLQPMPSQNRLVGTWYTYDAEENPIFLTFDSCMEAEDGMNPGVCATPGGFDGVTATTALYLSTGGGPDESDVVTTTKVGTIDYEILGCEDAIATVRMPEMEPATYTAKQLTRPFPCVDSAAAK
jgi:hypothetical protein